jgi:putative radical SAM enzyme (TIGR03279 family)
MIHGGEIVRVQPGSIAEELGLEPGDVLRTINKRPLRDVIDYRFYSAADFVELLVERGEDHFYCEVEKAPDEPLGVEFGRPTFNPIRQCANACPFCFVDQNMEGMRKSLYIRDDDYRYSFLFGNFVTFTNLTPSDWRRLEEQRLSPLYVSVHATEPALRRKLLGYPSAPDILEQLARLREIGIQVHTQIVSCPGLNDGPALERTLDDLAALYPTVLSVAVVPVGLTKFRGGSVHAGGRHDRIIAAQTLTPVRSYTPEGARRVVRQAEERRARMRRAHGTSFVFASDEFYLLAGRPVPSARSYEGFPQLENGIGMVRHMWEGWKTAKRVLPAALRRPRTVSILCGTLPAPVLEEAARELEAASEGLRVRVLPVENRFYGPDTNVSGLLVGRDLLDALPEAEGSDLVLVPRFALDNDGRRLLDDVTLEDLRAASPAPLEPAGDLEETVDLIARLDRGERLGTRVLEPRLGGFEFSPVSSADTFGEVLTYS